jgi:hypothetical protein
MPGPFGFVVVWFCFLQYWFELRAYTLSHSTPSILFCEGFCFVLFCFEIGSHELFALALNPDPPDLSTEQLRL